MWEAGDQVEHDQQYAQRLAEIDAKVREARLTPDVVLARAAGLLAGRIGCRVDAAHTHLLRLAADRGRAAPDLAAELIRTLEQESSPTPRGPLPTPRSSPEPAAWLSDGLSGGLHDESPDQLRDWAAVVREVLDVIPGRHTLLKPVRDAAGTIVDFTVVAVSRAVREEETRRGRPDIVGVPVRVLEPRSVDGPAWQAWLAVAADGEPRDMGPVPYPGRSEVDPAQVLISSRVRRVGPWVMTSWIRHDEEERLTDRLAQTERLGDLGWGEADLVTGETAWSDGLYRIYERDPALGPLTGEQSRTLTLPEDLPVHQQAAELFGRGETVDISYRLRIAGRVKHVRTVLDAVRDVNGRPIRVYGIVQDVTARETTRAKLAEVERLLHVQQQTLAAENRLTAQLQQIVLPVPETPVEMSGLRIALRYLPAEQANHVGGDWYHAATADDGSLILAVGDVAGHGIQAATAMAQLRHTLAALTLTTTSNPAELLGHLNRVLCSGKAITETATAVIARWDASTGVVRWAQAGHPAPLHTRGGVTTELPRPTGVMLGALDDARYVTAELTLDLGDLLVLYTDGLVEHRDHSRGDGLAPVLATLNRIATSDSEHPLAELRRANPDDDTCILAARRLPD